MPGIEARRREQGHARTWAKAMIYLVPVLRSVIIYSVVGAIPARANHRELGPGGKVVMP